jgi:hypothetical protein
MPSRAACLQVNRHGHRGVHFDRAEAWHTSLGRLRSVPHATPQSHEGASFFGCFGRSGRYGPARGEMPRGDEDDRSPDRGTGCSPECRAIVDGLGATPRP